VCSLVLGPEGLREALTHGLYGRAPAFWSKDCPTVSVITNWSSISPLAMGLEPDMLRGGFPETAYRSRSPRVRKQECPINPCGEQSTGGGPEVRSLRNRSSTEFTGAPRPLPIKAQQGCRGSRWCRIGRFCDGMDSSAPRTLGASINTSKNTTEDRMPNFGVSEIAASRFSGASDYEFKKDKKSLTNSRGGGGRVY